MSIDGIGKGPGVSPGALPVEGVAEPQRDTALDSSGVDGVHSAAPSDALTRLQAGELSLDAYLDLQVSLATAHLEGTISAQHLDVVREQLRRELVTDPALTRLVANATGRTPRDDA